MNRYPPPGRDSFQNLPPRGAVDPLGIQIGGWFYRFDALDAPLKSLIESRYEVFATASPPQDSFQVRVLDGGVDHFVPPQRGTGAAPHPLTLGWEGELLTIRSFGFVGWVSLEELRGEIALARGEYEKAPWCLENYLRVCTAWRAAREGGALLHAASLARGRKAYIFMGASGSGKSTLAATSREGRVISDDLTLIRRLPEGFRVAGTPFRGTYTGGEPLKGFFEVGGIYRIFKARENRIEKCSRDQEVAHLLASCPFVVDQFSRFPAILVQLRALSSAHPIADLHFDLSGSFWDVLPAA